jgi:hypothetical protein
MSLRAAAWLAWSLAGLSVAMFLASAALTIMSLYGAPATRPPSTWGTGGPIVVLLFLPFLTFPWWAPWSPPSAPAIP